MTILVWGLQMFWKHCTTSFIDKSAHSETASLRQPLFWYKNRRNKQCILCDFCNTYKILSKGFHMNDPPQKFPKPLPICLFVTVMPRVLPKKKKKKSPQIYKFRLLNLGISGFYFSLHVLWSIRKEMWILRGWIFRAMRSSMAYNHQNRPVRIHLLWYSEECDTVIGYQISEIILQVEGKV